MPLIGWLFVGASAIAALTMAAFINRRERLALPGRRRRFVGIHELLMPFDEERYNSAAKRSHAIAQRAFAVMAICFIGAVLSAILAS
jgi:hypothetical protein